MEDWIVYLLLMNATMAALGWWVAGQKRREPGEGMALGILFGPLGVLVETLLPIGNRAPKPTSAPTVLPSRTLDEEGIIAYIADRFRTTLELEQSDWEKLPARRMRKVTSEVESELARELGLSPTRMADLAAEARRMLSQLK